MNGGNGCLSLLISSLFKKINIVEINKLHAEVIKNNLEVYDCK